ncbi:MAG: hypothetical protein JW730_19225 [Anaerolineales bacterium]|nr:hypothetical protein [Anaerolineales bacterium]
MKTTKTKKKKGDNMRAEYDFSKAERGKFHRPLDKGYSVHVKQSDDTEVVKHYVLAEGTILLEPDVREYFPDSQSVNEALRSLIQLIEQVPIQKYDLPKSGTRQVAEK